MSAPSAAARATSGVGPLAPPVVEHLPWRTILDYNLPTVGVGFMFFLVSLYLAKFATDVLLVPASAMGLIFLGSRVWDAVTDPLAGYLSDRTGSRMGRRRPWILASIVPVGLSYVMMWSPPDALEGGALVAWMACAVFLFYTSMTIFVVPHTALGAELTDAYHERTRIFGARHVLWSLGAVCATVALGVLSTSTEVRATARVQALGATLVTAAFLVWAVVRLRERPEYQGRGEHNPYKAFADVLRNPHARLLLAVFLIESLGGATIGVLTPYIAQYVVGTPEKTHYYILMYMAPAIASVPMWVQLSRRFGKKNLWLLSMVMTSASFGSMMFVGEGDALLISFLAFVAGLGNGCGSVVSPSVQADVIDYDEYRTGQRKEGAYFAAWNFSFKTATGVTIGMTLTLLDLAGFQPGQAQSESALFAMRALYALFPMVCYALGALLFLRFSLGEVEHREIRAELDARSAASRSARESGV